MKKIISLFLFLLTLSHFTYGQASTDKKATHGILFMSGGRYDNFRRCAATSAGTKGGPIADIMYVTKYQLNNNHSISFNLPVFRPILFAIAFKMLQFEPEFTYQYNKAINDRIDFIAGPGAGISFHYGPDYKSKLRDLNNSFFAIGPFLSLNTGIAFKREGMVKSSVCLKAFYVPLFAKDRTTGTVLGGALLYTIYFK
ncbi:MAG TPA: hypothetical protein DIW31_02505 [Bacteroidales bacterium]|nr:hypothetical protein [Bacteroidales bacterium]